MGEQTVLLNIPTVVANRFFFIFKALYLPFDILGLVALLGVLEEKNRMAGATAWMLNPFILYISYGWGQTDLIAASLTGVALYLAKKMFVSRNMKFGLLSCLALGFAASFKFYALALLPIFSILAARKTGKCIFSYLIVGVLPLVSVIPFLSRYFLEATLSSQGLVSLRNFPILPWTWFTIFPGFGIYLALIYYLVSADDLTFDMTLGSCLVTVAILYGLAFWVPNWFVWGVPFVLPAVIQRPRLFGVYVLLTFFYCVFAAAWGNAATTPSVLGMFFPLTDPVFGSGLLWNFPNLLQSPSVIPNSIQSEIIGLGYTGIGVSMFFIAYRTLKRGRSSKGSVVSPVLWGAVLLVPISLAAIRLYISRAYFILYVLPQLPHTFATKVVSDPAFFGFYFVLIALALGWLLQDKVRDIRLRQLNRRIITVTSVGQATIPNEMRKKHEVGENVVAVGLDGGKLSKPTPSSEVPSRH
jgi:hypothetical protein